MNRPRFRTREVTGRTPPRELIGFVKWPACRAQSQEDRSGFWNSGEEGMECWLLLPQSRRDSSVRGVCFTYFFIGLYVAENMSPDLLEEHRNLGHHQSPLLLDAAVCIGATPTTPWDCSAQELWKPTYGDFTVEGQKLFDALASLYGLRPLIATVLAT